jgi:hypothetical protein
LKRCAFRGGKEQDSQRTKLADEVRLCAPEFDRPERRRTLKNLGLCVGESLNFCAGAIDLDMQIGRSAIGVSKLENVLTFPAVGMSADGVGRGTSAASGIDNAKAGKGRSISIYFYSCIEVMAPITFGDSKRRAAVGRRFISP